MRNVSFASDEAALVHRFINELSSIRSAAEILRDVPDINEIDRVKFVAVVLEGERHLEDLLMQMPQAAGRKGCLDGDAEVISNETAPSQVKQ